MSVEVSFSIMGEAFSRWRETKNCNGEEVAQLCGDVAKALRSDACKKVTPQTREVTIQATQLWLGLTRLLAGCHDQRIIELAVDGIFDKFEDDIARANLESAMASMFSVPPGNDQKKPH